MRELYEKSFINGFSFKIVLSICILFIQTNTIGQTTYYVDQAVTTSGAGTAWSTAFKTLQEAMDISSNTVVDEIWVARGTYIPNKNPYGTRYDPPSYSYSMTFYFKKHVKVYGGFNGTETMFSQRDWNVNETILSANIQDPADSTDNLYHVILAMGTEAAPLGNDLVLDGFTITGGYANVTGSMTVNGMAVYYYNGGGIYNINASPTLSNLKIVKNVAFVGGGIHNKNSSPKISNCTISGNYSSASGGGIYNLGSDPVINNSIISNNKVNNEGGGGMDNHNSNPILNNVQISNNQASKGGGMANDGGTITLNGVLIEGNKASTNGGGLYNFTGTVLNIDGSDIRNNTAQYGGGLNSFRMQMNITNSRISSNTGSYYGGGLYLDGCTVSFTNSHIDSNKAVTYQAGGFFAQQKSVITFSGGTIKGNSSKTDAGGVLLKSNAIIDFNNLTIEKNISSRYGGGIYVQDNSDISLKSKISNTTFIENEAFDGAGVYLANGVPILENVTFKGNKVTDAGGGLFCSFAASPVITNCLFESNTAANAGGALFIQNGGLPEITSCTFLSNSSTEYGGALYCAGNPFLTSLKFRGNASKKGGSIYLAGPTILTNVQVTGSYASENGGAIYIDNAAPVLTNVTISGNNALLNGGGIYADRSNSAKMRNTIIFGNSSGLYGYVARNFSLVQGINDVTNGNMNGDTDPVFKNAPSFTTAPFTGGDYILLAGSPLLDKGSNSFYDAGQTPDLSFISTDVNGNDRIYNSIIDLGSSEHQPGILPLHLVSFTGKRTQNSIRLDWQTSDEKQVSLFSIERSLNGAMFEEIDELFFKERKSFYEYLDNFPLSGNNFYRLKIIDKDGGFMYSKTVHVNMQNPASPSWTVYPNPARDLLKIFDEFQKPLSGSFAIIESNGKVILRTTSNPVNLSNLKPGYYLLQINGSDGRKNNIPFIKR